MKKMLFYLFVISAFSSAIFSGSIVPTVVSPVVSAPDRSPEDPRPEIRKPEVSQPDVAEPKLQPDILQPKGLQPIPDRSPENPGPEARKPESLQPDSLQPDGLKPEAPVSCSLILPEYDLPAEIPSRGFISCCPTVCPPCNPCVPACLVSGSFRVADIYPCPDNPPVIEQIGCDFIVTPQGDGRYLVSLIKPFCKPLIVTASKSNTFPLDDVSNVVTVLSNPVSPADSFVLGNIQCGDFVQFHAVPVDGCF